MKLLKVGRGINPELRNLKGQDCVYFLLRGTKIVYIGSTANIQARISHHKSIRWIKNWFTKFCFIKCDDYESSLHYEKRWIRKFRPKYNGGGRPSVTYEQWMELKGRPLFLMK